MVYAFTVLAALIVATGEVVQQRLAAQAPPQDNLSPRLLLWLVQRPRWLLGVGCSLVGNLLFALALGRATVIRVEAIFVIRLVFGLTIAALWGWHRVPLRDIGGAILVVIGVVAVLLTARPESGSVNRPSWSAWALGVGVTLAVVTVLTVLARRLRRTRRATLLGAGAGILFGLQSVLVQSSVATESRLGLAGLLTSWNGYATVVVAVSGMLLVQSAFEAAPLTASYPAVVIGQLCCSFSFGVLVLSGVIHLAGWALGAALAAIAAMVVGIVTLTRSPLVTGQLDGKPSATGRASRVAEPPSAER